MGEYAEERGRQAAAVRIAAVCHEANRILTGILKDVPLQPHWEECPEEMKKSSIAGVLFMLENPEATPEQSHEDWCTKKIADGWAYGPEKDVRLKTHPALRPYAELSDGVHAKDEMFRLIIKAMS